MPRLSGDIRLPAYMKVWGHDCWTWSASMTDAAAREVVTLPGYVSGPGFTTARTIEGAVRPKQRASWQPSAMKIGKEPEVG